MSTALNTSIFENLAHKVHEFYLLTACCQLQCIVLKVAVEMKQQQYRKSGKKLTYSYIYTNTCQLIPLNFEYECKAKKKNKKTRTKRIFWRVSKELACIPKRTIGYWLLKKVFSSA